MPAGVMNIKLLLKLFAITLLITFEKISVVDIDLPRMYAFVQSLVRLSCAGHTAHTNAQKNRQYLYIYKM